ncbi:MAG: hypothetical protein WAV26_11690, partial [Candidatus Deferrimicrobium sp.]
MKMLSYPLDFLLRRRSIVKFLLREELIVYAITGERRTVVEKLDALVKGYKPMYEFHRGSDATDADHNNPKTAEQGRSCELPLNRDSHGSLDPALPLPFPPS